MTQQQEALRALYLPPQCRRRELCYENCLTASVTVPDSRNEDWDIVDIDW